MEPINQNFNNQNPNNMKNKENLIGNCLDDFEFLKILVVVVLAVYLKSDQKKIINCMHLKK